MAAGRQAARGHPPAGGGLGRPGSVWGEDGPQGTPRHAPVSGLASACAPSERLSASVGRAGSDSSVNTQPPAIETLWILSNGWGRTADHLITSGLPPLFGNTEVNARLCSSSSRPGWSLRRVVASSPLSPVSFRVWGRSRKPFLPSCNHSGALASSPGSGRPRAFPSCSLSARHPHLPPAWTAL